MQKEPLTVPNTHEWQIPNKLRIEENFLNLTNNIFKKSTANVKPTSERLGDFPLRWEVKQGYSLLLLLFNSVLEVLANALRREKEMKRNTDWYGKNKTIFGLMAWLFIEKSPKNLQRTSETNKLVEQSYRIKGQCAKRKLFFYICK